MANQKQPTDYVARGKQDATPLGTTLFVGLRALDPLLQRSILLASPLNTLAPKLGMHVLAAPPSGGSILSSTGLTPFQSTIWFMSIGSAVKQIFWLLFISKESMYAPGAIMISAFNTVVNSLNTLVFTAAASNPTYFPPWSLYIGAVLYPVGIVTETVSEWQRKRFKDHPENKGKIYSGGLWSLATNINYGGYSLWRGSYALAAGGPVWGSLMTAFFLYDFSARAIPALDIYLTDRYGEQWKRMKQEVRYTLIPGII